MTRALELLMHNEPVVVSRQTHVGPLILPLCLDPPLQRHELVFALMNAVPPLDAAIAAETVDPQSYAARVSSCGVLVLPPSLADVPLIGNAAVMRLWHESFLAILSACRAAGPGHHRRLVEAFSIRPVFQSSDAGMLKQLLGRLGIQWRLVPRREASFCVGDQGYRVAARDYGLLQTLLLSGPFGPPDFGGLVGARRVLLGGGE